MSLPGVIYDYKCKDCQESFEHRHPMAYEGSVLCPTCGSNSTQKVISSPASVLDWHDSDSVHASQRFRGCVLNTTVGGQ